VGDSAYLNWNYRRFLLLPLPTLLLPTLLLPTLLPPLVQFSAVGAGCCRYCRRYCRRYCCRYR
jgi:hypothetical protein